jgi:hypothetical protein
VIFEKSNNSFMDGKLIAENEIISIRNYYAEFRAREVWVQGMIGCPTLAG